MDWEALDSAVFGAMLAVVVLVAWLFRKSIPRRYPGDLELR